MQPFQEVSAADLVVEAPEGQHVEAGREHLEGAGEDGQFALLGLARVALHAHNVPNFDTVVQRHEGCQVTTRRGHIGHHLDP
jgi:hypothetical protein